MFWIIVAIIAVLSFILSVMSLIGESDKREIKNAKKQLQKDKIVYQASSSSVK